MVEVDKLSAGQRLRLEALAQAVASSGAMSGRVQTASDILKRAHAYENYILTGALPTQPGQRPERPEPQ